MLRSLCYGLWTGGETARFWTTGELRVSGDCIRGTCSTICDFAGLLTFATIAKIYNNDQSKSTRNLNPRNLLARLAGDCRNTYIWRELVPVKDGPSYHQGDLIEQRGNAASHYCSCVEKRQRHIGVFH